MVVIVPVECDNVDLWLELVPDADPATIESIRADVKQSSSRIRLMAICGDRVAAGCIVDIDGVGAVLGRPRLRSGLGPAFDVAALVELAIAARDTCRRRQVRFIECSVRLGSDMDLVWQSAIDSARYQFVCRKERYQLDTGAATTPFLSHGDDRVCNVEFGTIAVDIDALYRGTLRDSLDRFSVLEESFGVGLGSFDTALVCERAGFPIGLCAIEYQVRISRAWVKYVGVVPSCRHSGVGRALLCHAREMCCERGIRVLDSLVDPANSVSVALHNRCGFAKTAEAANVFIAVLSE